MQHTPEKDLHLLIQQMMPHLHEQKYAIISVHDNIPSILPFAVIREKEGITLILTTLEADKQGLAYEQEWALISLEVFSSLDAVGFTAIVSKVLADNGISANMVAGYYHDYVLVPYLLKEKACMALHNLSHHF